MRSVRIMIEAAIFAVFAAHGAYGFTTIGYEASIQTVHPRLSMAKVNFEDSTSSSTDNEALDTENDHGVYRRFAEHAWEKLKCLDYMEDAPVDSNLLQNQSPVNPRDGSIVRISVQALQGVNDEAPIRYARYALLETVPARENSIQVLNMVIFPNSGLPVWGADFVSLPGNKHLLLLDAQPMISSNDYSDHWEDWFQSHVAMDTFPWGGDLPEKVQPFVSKYALWSRLGDDTKPVAVKSILQGQLYNAFEEHMQHYLELLKSSSVGEHQQDDYIAYRLENDPARPMLKRLFGEEWTEQVLETVLFPK